MDLFSGIGGFSSAVDVVWNEEKNEHIFCDNDRFCQAVLRRHWPESKIWSDIRELIAHAKSRRYKQPDKEIQTGWNASFNGVDLLTGGFPCQPFSHAGKRRGKSDDRFLWPEMLECIRLFRPAWVIAENVYGILNIENGLVFEQVCSDMEEAGYEVWPFIVPACAVNAPHRRDRVWIVGHSTGNDQQRSRKHKEKSQEPIGRPNSNAHNSKQSGFKGGSTRVKTEQDRNRKEDRLPLKADSDAPDTCNRHDTRLLFDGIDSTFCGKDKGTFTWHKSWRGDWNQDWREVAASTCIRGVDDGLPEGMVGISEAKHRTERLKMLGNSIVPQVAVEIMRTIKMSDNIMVSSVKEKP